MSLLRKSLNLSLAFRNFKGSKGLCFFSNAQTQPKHDLALIPKLVRKPEAILVKYWWSETR